MGKIDEKKFQTLSRNIHDMWKAGFDLTGKVPPPSEKELVDMYKNLCSKLDKLIGDENAKISLKEPKYECLNHLLDVKGRRKIGDKKRFSRKGKTYLCSISGEKVFNFCD